MSGSIGRRNSTHQKQADTRESTVQLAVPETSQRAVTNPKDHREFTRVAIGKRAELRAGEQVISGASIASLSLGGLLVRSGEQLPMSTRCEITIYLVEGDSQLQIHARGSVVRSDRWGMALKFSKVLGLDSLEGLHDLVVGNAPDTAKAEREFQSHQRLRWLESGTRPQNRWRDGDAAPLWLRRARRPLRSRPRLQSGLRTHDWTRMNPVQDQILTRIEGLPEELRSLRSLCRKYLQYCSLLNASVCLIGHRSWEAPLDYLIELYPPARKSWFQTYRKLHGIVIPRQLQNLLSACNGFSFGDFICFGIPPSMLCTPPTLDENTWQPFDIGTATTEWIQDFPRAQGMTYFAGGLNEHDESIGYFMDEEQIVGMRSTGEIITRWNELGPFLEDVLAENERILTEAIPESWWH